MGRYVLAEDYVRALAGREVLRARGRRGAGAATTRSCCRRCRFRRRRSARHQSRSATRRSRSATLMLRLTQLFNLTGHPAISIAVRIDSGGPAVRASARRCTRRRPTRSSPPPQPSSSGWGNAVTADLKVRTTPGRLLRPSRIAALRRARSGMSGRTGRRRNVRRRNRLDVRRRLVDRIRRTRECRGARAVRSCASSVQHQIRSRIVRVVASVRVERERAPAVERER